MAMRNVSIILAVLVLGLGVRASAQVKAGDASVDLNATVSAGYSDNSSNVAGSDHSFVGGGAANLFGSYYNPNFLSFSASPYYNQSRLNSTFQSITAASGVSATANIFSGSHFPGSISYSDTLNSSGNFGIPGLANYTTHGNTDTLGVNWGVHLEDLPTLNLSFSNANNAYSIYGANTQGNMHSNVFSATSGYQIAGFHFNGGYEHSGVQTVIPEILAGEAPLHSNTGTNSFSFGVGHNLPWNGSASAAATRMKINTDYGDTAFTDKFDTNIDTLSGALNFAPVAHLNVGANTYYTDNLEGTLYNTLETAGVSLPQFQAQQSSSALSLTGYVNYEMPAEHLILNAYFQRQQQTFLGSSFASDSYNGTATYSNSLLGGQFNGVLGMTRTSTNASRQSMLGLNGTVNYARQIRRWTVGGGLNYSQATQTVLIAYTSSGFSYNGNLARRLGRRAYWGAYASGGRSLLTNQPGSANSSHSYSTSLSLFRFSLNGSYSTSSGNALLTPTGLVPTPLPLPVISPGAVVLYNGRSYSTGISSSPKRGLTLSASYGKGLSDTRSPLNSSNNNNETAYFLLMYNFRKIGFTSGYSRLVQGFSLPGTQTARVNSFYVGISRWFSFF
jgi:hypothetical protein